MYTALLSVIYGSILTFGQAAALFSILDLEDYVAYRAVLNTMNNAAPFLCLGFDSAAPVLKRMTPNIPFFWNILLFHVISLIIFIIFTLALPAATKLLPLILGLATSTSVAAALVVANHYRAEGAIRRYFIGINVADKSVRALIIIGLAVLTHDLLLWAILLSLLCFIYVFLIALKTGCRIRLDLKVFVSHLRISIPYVFAALGLVAITRMPFYAAFLFESDLLAAKIDIWLLFSLFILIPVLNKSKIEESKSTGIAHEYIVLMKKSWVMLRNQEILICLGIILISGVAVHTGHSIRNDLVSIILPLMIGMILISSQPNYVHILCLFGRFSLAIRVSFFIALVSIITYSVKLVNDWFAVPFLFVVAASMYCVIGAVVARLLEVKIADFWRWREALLLICFSALSILLVDLLIFR